MTALVCNLDDKELFMRTVKGVSWVQKRQMNMSKVQVVCGYVTSTTAQYLILLLGSSTSGAIANINPPKPAAATGLVFGALEAQDEDSDGDGANGQVGHDLKNDDSKPSPFYTT
jgi:hypothetical protein